MVPDVLGEIQRWTAKRRVALVVSILKGETSVAEAARKHGLKVAEVEEWQERFLLVAENGLRARPRDEEVLKEEHIKKLKQKIDELVLDSDILRRLPKAALRTRRHPASEGTGWRTSPSVGSVVCCRCRARRCVMRGVGRGARRCSTRCWWRGSSD